jgi:hypothetical protein
MEMSKERMRNIISACFCVGLACYIFYLTLTTFVQDQATGGGPFANSAFYPQVVAGVIIFLSVLLVISSFIRKTGGEKRSATVNDETLSAIEQPREGQPLGNDKISRKFLIAIAFILIAYTVFLDMFGYVVVTPFFMALIFWMLKIRKWIAITLLSVISTFVMYVFFSSLLEVILPPGRYSLIWW